MTLADVDWAEVARWPSIAAIVWAVAYAITHTQFKIRFRGPNEGGNDDDDS